MSIGEGEPMEVDILNVDNDELEWIIYEKGKSSEPFDDWLHNNLPSTVEK